jgi:hypothetical protein
MKALALMLTLVAGSVLAQSGLPPCDSNTTATAIWTNCFGIHSDINGNKYVGEWRDGTFHGQGTTIWATGDKHVGEYGNGERNGQGTHTSVNGDKYIGTYKDSKRSGYGTFSSVNGDKYVGEVGNGQPNGQGVYTFSSGDKYVGEFKDGTRNGQGLFTFANNKAPQEGFWENNKFVRSERIPDHIAGRNSQNTSQP